jgi:hypothetical protein
MVEIIMNPLMFKPPKTSLYTKKIHFQQILVYKY